MCADSGPSLPCKAAAPPASFSRSAHTRVVESCLLSAGIRLANFQERTPSAAPHTTPGQTGQVRGGIITRTSRAISITASGADLAAWPSRRRAPVLASVHCLRQPRSCCRLSGPACQTADSTPAQYADNTLSLMLSHPHLANGLRIQPVGIEPCDDAALPPAQWHRQPLHPLRRSSAHPSRGRHACRRAEAGLACRGSRARRW